MNINDNVLQNNEKIIYALRELYASRGYSRYAMSKFEEYDLYAKNKDFLVSDNVITFTDTNGKLMALKPDVTISIAKNTRDIPEGVRRIYYSETVYRVSKSTDSFREIMQTGVECLGDVGTDEMVGVIELAAESLSLLSDSYAIDLSTVAPAGPDGDEPFREVLARLKKGPYSDRFRVNPALSGDENYYSGIVFKGYLAGIPEAVLSGGRYDRLMRKLGRSSKAAGFAVYTDRLERLDIAAKKDGPADADWINIALPKGRLGEQVYAIFAAAGYECPALLEPGRKLLFENPARKVRYFWVKPSDVAIYVERGAADVGVCGKDILLEAEPDVYELADLGAGKCRMAIAGPKTYADDAETTLRVATKFPNIAKTYYRSKGRAIDVIKLNGSIEIAPLLGLSDVICDIVETGKTLRENDLEVKEEIAAISARFIANKSAYTFKTDAICRMAEAVGTTGR